MSQKLLSVMSVCEKDADSASATFELCVALDGQIDATLLLAYPDDYDAADVFGAACNAFKRVILFTYPDRPGDWPCPQNNAWQCVARRIDVFHDSLAPNARCWLWWEPDAVPLRKGWLAALAEAYFKGRKPFAGVPLADATTPSGYLNGVAIYPMQVVDPLSRGDCAALWSRAYSFDRLAGLEVQRAGYTDLSKLILHYRKPQGGSTAGRLFSVKTAARLLSSEPLAVMYHGCTDGSLQAALQGRDLPLADSEADDTLSPATVAVPSFVEQTTWPSGLFTFPTSTPLTCHFNPSLLAHDGALWLFTRRQTFHANTLSGPNRNDLAIWRIREPSMTLDPAVLVPATPSRHAHEQFEDPRAMVNADGHTYVSFATWLHNQSAPAIRQTLCRLSPDWTNLEVVAEPFFGGNAPFPAPTARFEKNWTYFESDGAWQFVYSINPHVVGRLGADNRLSTRYETPKRELAWSHGEPRGGTPPIRLNEHEYLSFFHSALPWRQNRRRYYMGAYTFAAQPPHNLLRMTPTPILAGSEHDPRMLTSPLVIFPGGAVRQGDDWLVVFGVNDEHCGWLRVPHSALEERLAAISNL